jgi:2-methylisocitrate lyase-like PEP mutase family enzyme
MDIDTGKRLSALVNARQAILVPGAANALAARVVEDLGFEALYVTGAGVTNSFLGAPDLGFIGLAELVQHTAAIREAVNLPIIVDADTGFGNALNVGRAVRALERAGADAVQIEDQAAPKRCGHFAGKEVVPAEEMIAKIRAAVDARRGADCLVIARTDARATLGFDAAIERAARCIEAGADLTFVEAPESVEELKRVAESFEVPQFANPLVGGRTPILSPKEFEQLGFSAICFGLETIMHAAKAIQLVLDDMRSGRFALRDKGMSFEEFKAVVHYERWDRIDNLYGVQG